MISYVFKRYETKYILSAEQYAIIKAETDKRLSPDAFGETTIQSLYFDTPDFRLVRASIEKPIYKEKLRLRCYGLNDGTKTVFLEMKRKYNDVVYKRRIACLEDEVKTLFTDNIQHSQIYNEMLYFINFYQKLYPRILILSDRAAFFDNQIGLRVTYDRNVRYRTEKLNFHTSLDGIPLLPDGNVIMEIKTGTAIPLWLCRLLSENKIFKSSFSKYGTAYKKEISGKTANN